MNLPRKKVTNQTNRKVLVQNLELAHTLSKRIIGLMGRPLLPNGEGLLIKRSGNSIHTFFMKFPIDLVFLNSKGQVKHLAKNIRPWRIVVAPLFSQTDCLELPAGTIENTETKIGDILSVEA